VIDGDKLKFDQVPIAFMGLMPRSRGSNTKANSKIGPAGSRQLTD